MSSPLSPPTSPSSSSASAIALLVDHSAGTPGPPSASLHFCRRPTPHLGGRSTHLTPPAAGTCVTPLVDAVLANGFAGHGTGAAGVAAAFVGAFAGAAAVAPLPENSAFYAPQHVDNALDGWHHHHHHHHPVAAAAAAVGIGGIATGGWTTFDPRPIAAAAAGYAAYGSVSYGLDVRRKNATRESTSTLKAWLFDHIKNPYPTKGEKIMLAIITKMTLTQVSTWFANARRRLKKENKMQWPPRQRPNDDDDDDDDDKNSLSDENDDVIGGRKNDVTGRAADGGGGGCGRHLERCSVDSDDDEGKDVIVDIDCDNGDDLRCSPVPLQMELEKRRHVTPQPPLLPPSPLLPSPPSLPRGLADTLDGGRLSQNIPDATDSTPLSPSPSRFPSVPRELPSSRSPLSRRPSSRSPLSRRPSSRSPLSRRPSSRSPLSRRPSSRSPLSRRPSSRACSPQDDSPPKTVATHFSSSTKPTDQEVKVKPRIWSLVDTATSGLSPQKPETGSRFGEVFPVVGDGGGLSPWLSFHSSVEALPPSVVHPQFYRSRSGATGSHVMCALMSPRGAAYRTSQAAFAALNGGPAYCGLSRGPFRPQSDRKFRLDNSPPPPPPPCSSQSVDL